MNRTGCFCSAARLCVFSIVCTCTRTAELPHDTARAAGCSPKTAFAAENVPWHSVNSRTQGGGATSGRFLVTRLSNPGVIFCGCTRARRYRNRAQDTRRLARRLPLHNSSVPGVNCLGNTMRDQSHRLLLLCCLILQFPPPLPASLTDGLYVPQHTADAAKLLSTPETSRGILYAAVREAQGLLLAGLGQQGNRVLVSSSAGVHGARRKYNRVQHARRRVGRLPLRNRPVRAELLHGAAARRLPLFSVINDSKKRWER
jgi:hypothetical protein